MLFANNPTKGQSAMMSFGPTDMSGGGQTLMVAGYYVDSTKTFGLPINEDDLRRNYTAFSIRTTPEQAQDVVNYINHFISSDHPYELYGTNCATVCRDALKAIGLLPKNENMFTRSITPTDLWLNINARFGHGWPGFLARSGLPWASPGKDFGSPRTQMNTFDFVTVMLTPPQACVTVSDSATGASSTSCD
jgi:hypothetical protein